MTAAVATLTALFTLGVGATASAQAPSRLRLIAHESTVAEVPYGDAVYSLGDTGRIVRWDTAGTPHAWAQAAEAEQLVVAEGSLWVVGATWIAALDPVDLTLGEPAALAGYCASSTGLWTWTDTHLSYRPTEGEAATIALALTYDDAPQCHRSALAWASDEATLAHAEASGITLDTFAWPYLSTPRPVFAPEGPALFARVEGAPMALVAGQAAPLPYAPVASSTAAQDPASALAPALAVTDVSVATHGVTVLGGQGWYHVTRTVPPRVTHHSAWGRQVLGAAEDRVATCQAGEIRLHDARSAEVVWESDEPVDCAAVTVFSAAGRTTLSVGGRALDLTSEPDWIALDEATRLVTPARGLRRQRWRVASRYAAMCGGPETVLYSERDGVEELWDTGCGIAEAVPVLATDGAWEGIALVWDDRARAYVGPDLRDQYPVEQGDAVRHVVLEADGAYAEQADVVARVSGVEIRQRGRQLAFTHGDVTTSFIDLGGILVIEAGARLWAEQGASRLAGYLSDDGALHALTPGGAPGYWSPLVMERLTP